MKPAFNLNGRAYILIAFILFILTFTVYLLTGEGHKTPYDYFVPLADAFWHGRLYLLHNPAWLDELLELNGRYYVIYPPMPAILLLPQTFFSGLNANQTLTSVFFGALNVSLVYLLMRRVVENKRLQVWMALLFGFGTIHWYLASIGKAWFFAQVSSFFFLVAAVYETFGKKRPFLIGLLLGASFWCRLPTVLSLPFFLIMLSDQWYYGSKGTFVDRIRILPVFKLGAGVAVFILLNFLYNYLRFDTFSDIAYSIQAEKEPWWYPKGLFHVSYIVNHLKVFFLKPPIFMSEPPYVQPSYHGMSILITTPVFVYSVMAGIRSKISIACWSGVIPVALIAFLHGGTGWMMFGYRYAVDFYPFLLVLTALGIKSSMGESRDIRWEHKTLVIISILVNLWGVIWINKFGWVSLWE